MAYSGWIELAGVKLDTRQERNTYHKITFDVRDAYQRASLRGWKKDPIYAAWVREYEV